MGLAKLSEEAIWNKIRNLHEGQVEYYSLVQGNPYVITEVDEAKHEYTFQYKSGRKKSVSLRDIYYVYSELVELKEIARDHFRSKGEFDGSPGAALYGILPELDNRIAVIKSGRTVRVVIKE